MTSNHAFTFRPADPVQDLAFAYALFKSLTKGYVEALAGEWPEEWQYKFFQKGFADPDTKIVLYEGQPAGCFCIKEGLHAITLQRMYIRPDMQGMGFGGAIIQKRLRQRMKNASLLSWRCLKPIYRPLNFIIDAALPCTAILLTAGSGNTG